MENLRYSILCLLVVLPALFANSRVVVLTVAKNEVNTADVDTVITVAVDPDKVPLGIHDPSVLSEILESSNSVDLEVSVEGEDELSAKDVPGKYVFVPDTLQSDVFKLLDGHSKVVDDMGHLDLKEKTIHRGDTIPMVLKSINLGRFDRGLYNFLYVPKGTWQLGLTASYGELDIKDLDIFGLLSDVDMGVKGFQIKPYLQYFFRNNLALGLKFGYTKLDGNIGSFKVDVDEDINFSLNDVRYKSESMSSAMTLTQYLGLSRRGRFGVFNEIELALNIGNSEFCRPYNGELTTTKTNTMEAQLNFSPGVEVFIMKNVGFHVSFGVFGFYLKNEKQWENDEQAGTRLSSGANFRFNIFNINFGIAVAL